jgi:hypothetical protein
MAYLSSGISPSEYEMRAPTGANPFVHLRASLNLALAPLRRRWAYHQLLAALEGYSERDLADIGATQGAKAFARRAAGL